MTRWHCGLFGCFVLVTTACGSEAGESTSNGEETQPRAHDDTAVTPTQTSSVQSSDAKQPAEQEEVAMDPLNGPVDDAPVVSPVSELTDPEAQAPDAAAQDPDVAAPPDPSSDVDVKEPPGDECTPETEAIDCPSPGCLCCPASYCDNGYCRTTSAVTTCSDETLEDPATPEQLCATTGGMVLTRQCCEGAEAFASLCSGAVPRECACTEERTEDVSFCACPEGYCFDRTGGCIRPVGDMTAN